METFSALLAICAGNSLVTGEFHAPRPVTRNFDVSFDLLMNTRLSKQWWGWWFETPSCPLWCHCNEKTMIRVCGNYVQATSPNGTNTAHCSSPSTRSLASLLYIFIDHDLFKDVHYNDAIMDAMASQITSLTIVYSSVYSSGDQRIHQSSELLAFVRWIHRWAVNSPHKWPVTRSFDVFFDLRLNTRLSKQWWGWWF